MATVILLLYLLVICNITLSSADTYSVKIVTEQHVNIVDSRFLSFTIDPKYLFSTGHKYSSKECVCMASSLTPAYLRIAGPSTAHMTFHNTTISINDLDLSQEDDNFEIYAIDTDAPRKVAREVLTKKLAVTHREWRKFLYWAKSTGFDLVFALNNKERTTSSMWDPNTSLSILTVAEKANVGDIFWELGYECTNQSIEEYLNDLETLRVIIETFPPGRTGEWKVVGGDVTKCLQADSKSDFKDYITLSNDMMDALLLNGNSSTHELERMTEMDRLKLLRLLAHSKTPLWLTEGNQRRYNQWERAADWLASLGYSAKNGFSVHFRELEEEEMYEPTLSFYMALLFKNLVGERVLNVEMEPEQAILFGHCTSLRHKPVAGAVTLFGVNMDDEPARFSLKLSKREEGGDIMQFILGHDHSGNIVVNGRAMYYEGDIKPVVKRVRPYKTLLINLPAKSFGFWVLANTKIEACHEVHGAVNNISEEDSAPEMTKVKRSVDYDFDDYAQVANLTVDFEDYDTLTTGNKALKSRLIDINKDLHAIHRVFQSNENRVKREESSLGKKILNRHGLKPKLRKLMDANLDAKELLGNLLQRAKERADALKDKSLKGVKRRLNLKNNKVIKRHSKNSRIKTPILPRKYLKSKVFDKISRKRTNKHMPKKKIDITEKVKAKKPQHEINEQSIKKHLHTNEKLKKTAVEEKTVKKNSIENEVLKEEATFVESKSRKRRQTTKDIEEISAESNTEVTDSDKAKLWKILKHLNDDFKDISEVKTNDEDSQEGLILKTELSDDTATIKLMDSGKGVLKSTLNKVLSVLEDLNKNISKLGAGLSLFN